MERKIQIGNNNPKYSQLETEESEDPEIFEEAEKWIKGKEGIFTILQTILSILLVTILILAGILYSMRGGGFECKSSDLLSGNIKIRTKNLDFFEIMKMDASKTEHDFVLTGSRLSNCTDFCRRSFNMEPYSCDNEFCNVCHISEFDLLTKNDKELTPYTMCIKSCGCCMKNTCDKECKSFIYGHACGFECTKFGYYPQTACS